MMADEDVGVEIVHLNEGTVRIVLPPTVTQYQHPQPQAAKTSQSLSPTSVSLPHLTATLTATFQITPERVTDSGPAYAAEKNSILPETDSRRSGCHADPDKHLTGRVYAKSRKGGVQQRATAERENSGGKKIETDETAEEEHEGRDAQKHGGMFSTSSPSKVPSKERIGVNSDHKLAAARSLSHHRTDEHSKEATPPKRSRTISNGLYHDDNGSVSSTDRKGSDQPISSSGKVCTPSAVDISEGVGFDIEMEMETQQREKIVSFGSPFITTLSTGTTQIIVKQYQQEQRHKTGTQSTTTICNPQVGQTLIESNYPSTTDCLENRQFEEDARTFSGDSIRFSDTEVQQAHIYVDRDTPQTEHQHSSRMNNVLMDRQNERVFQISGFNGDNLELRKSMHDNRGQHPTDTDNTTEKQRKAVGIQEGTVYKKHRRKHPGRVILTSESEMVSSDETAKGWIFQRSAFSNTKVEGTTSLKEDKLRKAARKEIAKTEDESDEHDDTENSVGSEWRFNGQTFTRAMWKNVSAHTNPLDLSFSTRIPFSQAPRFDFRHFGEQERFSSSTDEEWTGSPGSTLGRLRPTSRLARKGDKSNYKRGCLMGEDAQPSDMGVDASQKETNQTASGHTSAERYLRATFALADSKRSKRKSSSPKYFQPQTPCINKESKVVEGPNTQQSFQTTKSSDIKGVINPFAATQPKFHETSIYIKNVPCKDRLAVSDETPSQRPLSTGKTFSTQKDATNAEERPVNLSTHETGQLSSKQIIPDSRLAFQSSDSKEGSESVSSSADSVHTIYFIPDKSASRTNIGYPPTEECMPRLTDEEIVDMKTLAPTVAFTDEKQNREGICPKDSITILPDDAKSHQRLLAESDVTVGAFSSGHSIPKGRKSPSLAGIGVHGETSRGSCSTDSTSNGGSGSGHRQDSDKASLSSYDLFTSESEVGPLVSFTKTWNRVLGAHNLPGGSDLSGVGGQQEEVNAAELRRRFSTEEYVPASPYATHLRRKPSNISEGTISFVQGRRSSGRSSHVRQLSLDIGEEWESVKSPTSFLQPTSPLCSVAPEDESVFFGPETSFQRSSSPHGYEWTLSDEGGAESLTPRKKSHQTSAKLRLLYPNPADPRPCNMTEDEQRQILLSLTRAEVLRLQQADSPLLHLLKGQKGPARKKSGGHAQRESVEHQQQGTLSKIDDDDEMDEKKTKEVMTTKSVTGSLKPTVSVQPMSQVAPYRGPTAATPAEAADKPKAVTETDDVVNSLTDIESLSPSKRRLFPNHFNRINQRCHSTLQCPCCFFFCFLCCLPALYFMRRSDIEFDQGSVENARQFGRRTTVLFVVGAVLAVSMLVAGIVATFIYLQESLLKNRGWQ